MRCRYCGALDTKVLDSRPVEDGREIRRRRECIACKERFTTYEKIENLTVIVVKKSGVREAFDRQKMLNGIIRACEKRPVTMEQMDLLVSKIESELMVGVSKEIRSDRLGELVMNGLKDLDEVAYVRFASVYKQFKDIDTFISELSKLLEEKKESN